MSRSNTKRAEESMFAYLRYATMGEFFGTAGIGFVIWLVFTILLLVAEFLQSLWPIPRDFGLPRWLSVSAVLCAMLWFLRGQTLDGRIPHFGFVAWVGFSILITACAYVSAYAPGWFSGSFIWAALVGVGCLISLADKGKDNFAKLNKPVVEDEEVVHDA